MCLALPVSRNPVAVVDGPVTEAAAAVVVSLLTPCTRTEAPPPPPPYTRTSPCTQKPHIITNVVFSLSSPLLTPRLVCFVDGPYTCRCCTIDLMLFRQRTNVRISCTTTSPRRRSLRTVSAGEAQDQEAIPGVRL